MIAQTLEKAFIEIFERVINNIAFSDIDSLLLDVMNERPTICNHSQNNVELIMFLKNNPFKLRITLNITENIIRRFQEQNSGDSLVINILVKLYQNLEMSDEEIEGLERNFDIKSIFTVLVNSLSQVELLSHGITDQDPVESVKKTESEKMKLEK